MYPLRLAVLGGLLSFALTACGTSAKPPAGAAGAAPMPISRGVIDDPRTSHRNCMLKDGVQVTNVGATVLQVDQPPAGPRIEFEPTSGAAQQAQVGAQAEGAEVIGTALLFPNQASDSVLSKIESCLATGVQG